MPLQSIQQAIDALQKGGMIIVVDDEDRENEGDFICAAETITPEQVDFMLRIGRGTLCVPVAAEEAARLKRARLWMNPATTRQTKRHSSVPSITSPPAPV